MMKSYRNWITFPNRRGFTVLELIVVMLIISLITLLVFRVIGEGQAKRRDRERTEDLNAINIMLGQIRDGRYTLNTQNLISFLCGGATACAQLVGPDGLYYYTDFATGTRINPATPGQTFASITGALERGTAVTSRAGIQVTRDATTGVYLYRATGLLDQ
ncbi:MAG: prepilin-type N-terminal cleavage/methylation domain-containing protein [Parcubacteria group bacterium]|nr:prepilin-type N-terminal cleavage/methylation domain-containing protein [Parcubacteria group bacterium]